MKQADHAIFFRWASIAKMAVLLPSLLLLGCSHSVRKPALQPPAVEAITGVPACDAYLGEYLACHRAAGTYPADALQGHYQAMRDTLVQEAADPQVRPYLAHRCQGLVQQLRDTLQGRACAPPAAGAPPTR